MAFLGIPVIHYVLDDAVDRLTERVRPVDVPELYEQVVVLERGGVGAPRTRVNLIFSCRIRLTGRP